MITSEILKSSEYDFLRENEHLGKNLILLGLGGSYSYGTNIEGSDIDVRGITLNSKADLIGFGDFEVYTDENTDTVVYSLKKMIQLLMSCNPNTIEILGLKKEHYLYVDDIGRSLLDNRKMFLSKRAVHSFGGYADAQLRRLQNAIARDRFPQKEKEEHMLKSVQNTLFSFNKRYRSFENGSMRAYTDKAENPGLSEEIFIDADIKHYPLRDYRGMLNDLTNVIRDYEKVGKRNSKKDEKHLNKHAMHLVRLFMMALDILEKEEIITYRENEHELLMTIRNGGFMTADGCFDSSFYDMVADYEKRLEYAAENTALPAEPDAERIEQFVISVSEEIIRKCR